MQIKSLRIKSYRSWAIADTVSEVATARIKKLELYAELKSDGCTTALCLKAIGCSKATYYRWLDSYRRCGLRGLENQSRRPKRGALDNGQRSRSNKCCTCAGVIRCGANASSGRCCPWIGVCLLASARLGASWTGWRA